MFDATSGAVRPELLAPAGGPAALRAAVNNGADAVYLGLKALNARRGAENFTPDTLAEAIRYAHIRGVRTYLTANILTLEAELSSALETVDEAWAAGVDAVIIQDLGLLRLISRKLPDVRTHASTQIGAHNAATIAVLAEMGVSRVTLARELAREEIASLVSGSPVELECFVHGALCFCYSGQCLMSSMVGARSANRGLCAQPCRLPYSLVGGGDPVSPPGPYLLSPRDLAGITVLPALVRSGVSALKIEGRMKSAEYVAIVVRVYRAALDRAVADPDGFAVTPAEWATLEEAFNRGFTEGSLTRQTGEAKMSYRRPSNRGVLVGRVTHVTEGEATVALDRPLDADDTIEFWTGRGRFAQRTGEMTQGGRAAAHGAAGSRVSMRVEGRAGVGDRVFRIENASLVEAARRSFTEDAGRIVPADVAVRLRVGEPVEVTLSARGVTARARGPVVEEARTKRVSADEVVEHVGRFGGSAYMPQSWSIDLDPRAGIGFSALHGTRRDAARALDVALLRPWEGRARRSPTVGPPARPARAPRGAPDIVAAVSSLPAALACLDAGASRALLAVTEADEVEPLPTGVEVLLPRVAHEAEVEPLLRWAGTGDVATCGNPGLLALLAKRGVRAQADWSVNAVNPSTIAALADLGAEFVWASPELSGVQLSSLAEGSQLPVGALVYGSIELMVAEHCVVSGVGGCARVCSSCGKRGEAWRLRDAKGYEFPVRTDAVGRTHVYNSITLDLTRSTGELLLSGLAAVRLELQLEAPEAAAEAVRHWSSVLERTAIDAGSPRPDLAEPATTGHFYRGVR